MLPIRNQRRPIRSDRGWCPRRDRLRRILESWSYLILACLHRTRTLFGQLMEQRCTVVGIFALATYHVNVKGWDRLDRPTQNFGTVSEPVTIRSCSRGTVARGKRVGGPESR